MSDISHHIIDFASSHRPFATIASRETVGALVLGPRRQEGWTEKWADLVAAGGRALRSDDARLDEAAKVWDGIAGAIRERALLPIPGRPKSDNRKKSFEVAHEEAVARQAFLAAVGAGLSIAQANTDARASVMLDGLFEVWMRLRNDVAGLEEVGVNTEARCRLMILASAGVEPDAIEAQMREYLEPAQAPALRM